MKSLLALILLLSTSSVLAQTKYEKIKEAMKSVAERNPQTTKLIQVGESDSGDTILGLQIGNGATRNLVVATHHGNEYGSTVVAGNFAEYLASHPIPDQTLFVIPVLNISGYNNNNRFENARGKSWDPNRNYPGPCGTEGPFTLKSTVALARFIEQNNIVASATLHTFFPAVVYPWGISTRQTSTPYDNIFVQLGQAATIESKYRVGNSTKTIYPADGTFEDYAFWKLGIWSMLFELGTSHNPSPQDLQKMVKENIPGLVNMFLKAPKQRAPEHAFQGQCDSVLHRFDRHDE